MFFESANDIPRLAQKTGFSIFAITTDALEKSSSPIENLFPAKSIIQFFPDSQKHKILIGQIREISSTLHTKQFSPRFIIIHQADTMNIPAQNAFLKQLEEPKNNYHLVLLASSPELLLPTVRSRAQIFYPKPSNPLAQSILASPEIQAYAKRLITANSHELLELSAELNKGKDSAKNRVTILAVASVAIEMLYRAYFANPNPKLLSRIQKTIDLHHNISSNGNQKLHIVADLC